MKVVKRVKNKVSDLWGYVGGMLIDNFKGFEKEKVDLVEEIFSGFVLFKVLLLLFLNVE